MSDKTVGNEEKKGLRSAPKQSPQIALGGQHPQLMAQPGMREGSITPEHVSGGERPALLPPVTRPQTPYFCARQSLWGADLQKCVTLGSVVGRRLAGEGSVGLCGSGLMHTPRATGSGPVSALMRTLWVVAQNVPH